MQQTSHTIRKYLLLVIPFFALVVLLPANNIVLKMYNLSPSQYHILLFMIELPLALIWFAAFYGYAKLTQYAKLIKDTPEGPGFDRLAHGLTWLAWGLPVPAMVGLIVNAIASSHANLHPTAIVFNNYFVMVFAVISFFIIHEASVQIRKQTKTERSIVGERSMQVLFTVIGVVYCYFTLRHLDLQNINSTDNPYYLPVWLFVMTVIAPSLYAWFMGLESAYNIWLAARRSKGLIYRKGLEFLAGGLVLAIASLISIQYIRNIVPRVGHLSLNTTLVAVYTIYVITVCGFALIAAGANRLRKMEEV